MNFILRLYLPAILYNINKNDWKPHYVFFQEIIRNAAFNHLFSFALCLLKRLDILRKTIISGKR